ncbi:MAG TPA: hypothetical protein VER97_16235 [Geodermatophilus sp.]|nr:hypothetical protein [Geodermatophilus sp.]
MRCDAVIVATAMGSTAYDYAAGGPVVSPEVECILLTPAAPAQGISRTVLLGARETLTLTIGSGRPAVEIDGVLRGQLDPGDELTVSYRPGAGQLVRIQGSRSPEIRERMTEDPQDG